MAPIDDTATADGNKSNDPDASAAFWESPSKRPAPKIPERIGSYRILDKIGAGGMGIVYRAEQENPRRVVALKVIRTELANERLFRRFEEEAQMLGRLHHPGIAQIYEAGTTDTGHGAQPWFAMELIDGRSLTEYVAEQSLRTKARLELMARVCDAVHHAHQKSVIHRDLKPGNILVDRTGQPKIVDFGVARATDADIKVTTIQTDVGQLLGTLPYMSPEQIKADPTQLDTRSDVYALGVILYELLCARLPYDVRQKGVAEAARIIGEQEPAMLSMYSRVFRGDIETIVAKALEKDKERRYASASELAEDIRRYIRNEPIVARPASTFYQFRKFAKRHRALVTATAVVFISLIVGITATSIALIRANDAERQARADREIAEKQRNLAVAQARRADKTYRFLESLLVSADPYVTVGENLTVRDVLDRSAEKIKTEMSDEPMTEGAVRRTIGNTYRTLGLYNQAIEHLQQAVDICAPPVDPSMCHGRTSDLAKALTSRGDYDEAEKIFRNAIADINAKEIVDYPALSNHLGGLAEVLLARGHYEQGIEFAAEALALRREHNESPGRIGQALSTLATLKSFSGDWDEAEILFQESLPLIQEEYGEIHPQVCTAMSNVASMLEKRGEYKSAGALMQQVLDMRRKLLPPKHPDIAPTCNNLASVRRTLNDLEASEALYREALDIYIHNLGPDHLRVAVVMNNLAGLLKDKEDYEASLNMYQQVLSMLRTEFGSEHPHIATTLNNIATIYHSQHDFIAAESAFREAYKMQSRLLSDDHPIVSTCSYNLGGVLHHLERFDEAEPYYRKALSIRKSKFGHDHHLTLMVAGAYADLLRDTDRFEEAEPIYVDTIERFKNLKDYNGSGSAESLVGYGELLLLTDRLDEALPFADRAIAIREQTLSADHWQTQQARALLGKIRFRLGDYQVAEELLRKSLIGLEEKFGPTDRGTRKILEYLIKLHEQTNRSREAEPFRTKLKQIASANNP